jgi:hypothetical protein
VSLVVILGKQSVSSAVSMASSNGHFPTTLPILDGKNFDKWCAQMKVIFGYQDVWEIIINGLENLSNNATDTQKSAFKELKKKDCKALFILHQCVDAANFEKIAHATCAKDAWKILENSYEGAAKLKKVRLQILRRQYELLQMEGNEEVTKFFTVCKH